MLKTTLTVAVAGMMLVAACSTGDSKTGKSEPAMETDQAVMMAEIGRSAPDFTLTSSTGNTHSLSDFAGKYVVLEWVNYDCPFVKKHYGSGNMQNLQAAYTEKDVVWLSICSSAPGKQGYSEGQALNKRINQEKSRATAYLVDSDGKVGRMYGAKTTPHMYVINPEGRLVYAGAIDSKPSTNQADIPGATNYVMTALDAAMVGKTIQTSTTESYGCSVKY